MAARVVYLGEAELVPDPDDRVLELEIVTKLAARCADAQRRMSLALEAFPCDLQEQLNQFMDGRFATALFVDWNGFYLFLVAIIHNSNRDTYSTGRIFYMLRAL